MKFVIQRGASTKVAIVSWRFGSFMLRLTPRQKQMGIMRKSAWALEDCVSHCFNLNPSLYNSQVEVERMKAKTQDKFMNKLAIARHTAEEKRAAAETKVNKQAA